MFTSINNNCLCSKFGSNLLHSGWYYVRLLLKNTANQLKQAILHHLKMVFGTKYDDRTYIYLGYDFQLSRRFAFLSDMFAFLANKI